jgi:hypothetical protein
MKSRIFEVIQKRLEYENTRLLKKLEDAINNKDFMFSLEKEDVILQTLKDLNNNSASMNLWQGFSQNSVDANDAG